MSQVYSKIIPVTAPIFTSCYEYVHPWNPFCSNAIAGCFLYCIFDSLRIYGTVYLCTLLMKGRIPTKNDLRKTLFGILQSTAFLSFTGFGYSLFLCGLRRLMGHFNILTVSFIPAFLSSLFSILIERPSRRTLLCLYVSNVATETVWNMGLSRGLVKNIPYGDIAIFGTSMALLVSYYKSGNHKDVPDSMFKILKFVIGPYEEKNFVARTAHEANTFYRQIPLTEHAARPETLSRCYSNRKRKNVVWNLITQALKCYKKLIYRIKCFGRHPTCSHPFSCLYYSLGGSAKMFSVGMGIQITLKLVLNIKKIISSPRTVKQILGRKDILNLGLFLGLYSGVFRGSLCALRRLFGRDDPIFAFPAGLLAGFAFKKYPDTTVGLYVMWKAAQISYNIGIESGYVPKIPFFTEFLYCFSTAILFHAALLEPTNLRPSYFKFLHSISGGRSTCMARGPLDVWGLNSSDSWAKVIRYTKTVPVIAF